MRDYSKLTNATAVLLKKADHLFDIGNFEDAGYVYIEAFGSNSENDKYVSIDAMLGELKCDVYQRVQRQYFPNRQDWNDVEYTRENFKIHEEQIHEYKLIYEKHNGLNQDAFDTNAALEELNNIKNYYERSYRVYLENKKKPRGFFSRFFS